MHHRRRPVALLLPAIALALAACAGAGSIASPTPAPTVRPTPTPIAAPVITPADAAAIVIASDPRFQGAIELTQDVIGGSKWWTATPLEGGGYRVEITLGWGDCMAGCINRHTWTYDVTAAGGLELVSEAGDPVPEVLPGG